MTKSSTSRVRGPTADAAVKPAVLAMLILLWAAPPTAKAQSVQDEGAPSREAPDRRKARDKEKEQEKEKEKERGKARRSESPEREPARERHPATIEQAAPQAAGDAPLPPQGEPVPPPVVIRGPLSIRRHDLSLGLDHRVAPSWVASALLGVSRGRLRRSQTEYPADMVGQPDAATFSDTTLRTRSVSLAGMLSWMPRPDLYVDATLATMRTKLDVDRLVNELARFEGQTVGRAWSLSLGAGTLWRPGWGQVVPQVGLEYVDAQVDPLHTQLTYVQENTGDHFDGFAVGAQHTRSVNSQLGAQWQWPQSAGFGVWAPHLRGLWRERLWLRGDEIVATADGADPVLTDPATITPRRAFTLAGGVSLMWPGGTSAFADLGWTRGQGSLRERRLALGFKFEL